jgi:hypothetical protein
VISFRYHVISLVTVLLALAAGIVLGGGPLQRVEADDGPRKGGAAALAAARIRADRLEERLAFGDAYARATAGDLVAGALRNKTVTLMTLPGADSQAVGEVTDLVAAAGGQVTADVRLGRKLVDVANRQLVTELATQMHDSVRRKVRIPRNASGYERMGLLLAHAVATERARGAAVDKAGESVLAGLSTADLVTTRGTVDRRGSLVLVVGGAPFGSADQRSGAGSIVTTLARALDEQTSGVVVAGPLGSARADGVVAALRNDPAAAREVSTVDVVDRAAGAVVTVLALRSEAAERSGHYGSSSSADGAAPGASTGG